MRSVDTILNARNIYVVGIRSCAPLASFLSFYLNLVCDGVVAVNTNSPSEIFEQMLRINEEDTVDSLTPTSSPILAAVKNAALS